MQQKFSSSSNTLVTLKQNHRKGKTNASFLFNYKLSKKEIDTLPDFISKPVCFSLHFFSHSRFYFLTLWAFLSWFIFFNWQDKMSKNQNAIESTPPNELMHTCVPVNSVALVLHSSSPPHILQEARPPFQGVKLSVISPHPPACAGLWMSSSSLWILGLPSSLYTVGI